jgi:N utilization substance protein A
MEVPEIAAGAVEIVNVAREAGGRTKIAVKSNIEGVDPVGTFVGGRGSRVQAVMANIGEEKIDIVPYDENIARYIANALSPAKNILSVDTNEAERRALVKVPEDQLSLAIGRSGQNVRLAAKLTDWNIDIDGADESGVEQAAEAGESAPVEKVKNTDLEDEIIAAAETPEEETAEPVSGEALNPVDEDEAEAPAEDEAAAKKVAQASDHPDTVAGD